MEDLTEREEQRLRHAFAMIGEEAARDEPSQETTQPTASQPWLRRRSVVLAGALAIAAAVLAGGLVVTTGGGESSTPRAGSALTSPDSSEDGNGITAAQAIACSRAIVVGHVVAVRDASEPGRVVVTIDVQEWIKPASGPNRADFNVVDPRRVNEKRWKPGTRVLFRVPLRRDRLAGVSQGDHVPFNRKMFVQALPKARYATCPPLFRPNQD